MLTLLEDSKIYVCLEAVDMRKSVNGLSALIVDDFSENPQAGHLFLFCNKRRDRLKGLFWHRNGFMLIAKRLEQGKFKFPRDNICHHITIDEKQLSWLLAGLDFTLMQQFNRLDYSNYY